MTTTTITCPNCGAKNRVDDAHPDRRPVCGRCKTLLDAGAATTTSAHANTASADDGHPIALTDATFDRAIASAGDRPVLVDAWATWCPPCRALAPTIDALASEANGRWLIAKLDVDSNPGIAQRYNIQGIPTMLIFRNGKLVEQLVGLLPKPAILAKLQSHSG